VKFDISDAAQDRVDETAREIVFTVDSAACRTVVPRSHQAARGYQVHEDSITGQVYGTAKKGGPKIVDEGRRVLQTRVTGDEKPRRLNTRRADVSKPLMAVCDMVDHGQAVLFDSGGSYAFNKKTGVRTPFLRKGKEWEMAMTLEAPSKANAVFAGVLAAMRDAQASSIEPEIVLSISSVGSVGSALGVPGGVVVDAAAASTFLHGRVEPLFR
jgi:hypothetical protein